MKQVDLHVHSTYSDGTNTPSELIAIASSKNLSAIALTDHDTLDGIPDALKAAGNSEVELIPGVELSTNFNNTEVHIVGLLLITLTMPSMIILKHSVSHASTVILQYVNASVQSVLILHMNKC